MKKSRLRIMVLWGPAVLAFLFTSVYVAQGEEKTLVEKSESYQNSSGALGTMLYPDTKTEKPFLKKLGGGNWQVTVSEGKDVYSLQGKTGKYVSWFGIVRAVNENTEKRQTELLIEMKYSDGMTDLHQQIVSIYGAGDFKALITGIDHDIQRLSLVRVYGKVIEETNMVPTVATQYMRVWVWGQFAFMPYGDDKSNPEWVKLRTVSGSDACSSHPNREYYEKRLGSRD